MTQPVDDCSHVGEDGYREVVQNVKPEIRELLLDRVHTLLAVELVFRFLGEGRVSRQTGGSNRLPYNSDDLDALDKIENAVHYESVEIEHTPIVHLLHPLPLLFILVVHEVEDLLRRRWKGVSGSA